MAVEWSHIDHLGGPTTVPLVMALSGFRSEVAVSGGVRGVGRTLGCVVVGALAPVGQPAIKPIKPSCCGFAELSWHTSRLAEICLNTSTASLRIDKVSGYFVRNQRLLGFSRWLNIHPCSVGVVGVVGVGGRLKGHATCITQVLVYSHSEQATSAFAEKNPGPSTTQALAGCFVRFSLLFYHSP